RRSRRSAMKKLQACLVVCCLLLLVLSAAAQVQNGQFTGTVVDQTGAAIAGAKVTVTNPSTNLTVSTTTGSSGSYSAKELPAGTYKITTEASGFKTRTDANVVLSVGAVQRVDFRMEIGHATEVVEVSGEATAVQV